MSLVLDFSVCQSADCTKFTFTDNTGAYDASTNPTGWGAPNPTLADVITPCTLDITTPDGTTYQIDLVSTTPVFPVSAPPNTLTLDASSIGGTAGDSLPDGIYTFTYTVTTTGPTTYTQTITVGFYCQVKCCVFTMIKDLDITCDCCDTDKDTLMNAYLMYKGLIYAANCGNITQFNTILAALQKLCTQSNCQNCK